MLVAADVKLGAKDTLLKIVLFPSHSKKSYTAATRTGKEV